MFLARLVRQIFVFPFPCRLAGDSEEGKYNAWSLLVKGGERFFVPLVELQSVEKSTARAARLHAVCRAFAATA